MARTALLALIAALAAAPQAGATIRVSMQDSNALGGATGLGVVTDDFNRGERIIITGRLTPEGAVGNWDVDGFCFLGQFPDPTGISCIDESDDNCTIIDGAGVNFGSRNVRCSRITPGIGVNSQAGNDQVVISNTKNERVAVDAGPGDDLVTSQPFAITGIQPAAGLWDINLGTGNDTFVGSTGRDVVNGAAGADTLEPGRGPDQVAGGDGNDLVKAGIETDPPELDTYGGGPGFDTLDYSQRISGIFVALVGSTGGEANDDGISGFEKVLGGSGNDSILGFSSEGGNGNDVLTGGDAANTIIGGGGADVIRGFGGNDKLNANDGSPDTRISCSTGIDTVELDLKDPNPDDAQNCETINRRAVDEEPATAIATTRALVRNGRVGLRVRCPRAVGRACAGTLDLALAGARSARSARYRIQEGRAATVRIRLRTADAARVRRARRGLTAVATSRERGLKGDETVIRRLRLRSG
jgi:Ca2+-binding RTX toxin-like protein